MKEFSFTRLWNVMKYIYRFDRKWYLGWTLAAPCLLLGFILLLVVLGLGGDQSAVDVDNVGPMSAIMLLAICPIIVCSTFHPMYNKRRRIAFLSLPAKVSEKFVAQLLLNAMVLVATVAIVGLINYVVWVNDDSGYTAWNFRSIFVEFGAADFSVLAWALNVYLYLLMPSLLLFINSRVYRHNIVPSAIIVILLNTFGMFLIFLMQVTVDSLDDFIMSEDGLRACAYVLLGLEIVAVLVLWVMTYRNFKRSQIRDFFNR